MKFSIKDVFSKCDQIHSFLRIWSHFLKKCLMENFIFCAVCIQSEYSKIRTRNNSVFWTPFTQWILIKIIGFLKITRCSKLFNECWHKINYYKGLYLLVSAYFTIFLIIYDFFPSICIYRQKKFEFFRRPPGI